MRVRRAGPDDFEAVAALWREFVHEVPPPEFETLDMDKELGEIREILASETAFLAEDDARGAVGFALGRRRSQQLGTLTDLYVSPAARRGGVATELMRELVREFASVGVEHLDLDVQISNAVARSVYGRWGLRDAVLVMAASIPELEQRLAAREASSFGSIHVQSDDVSSVEHAVRQFVPRLPGASRGSLIAPPRNGWIGVYDDVCDRDPEMLRRLARELSDRRGAVVIALGVEQEEVLRMILFDDGRIVDEYLSVPEFYGPLPPGDVVGLAVNPRVVARLTGADPEAVRRIARTASAPADLPPARELLASFARELGIEGAEHGWTDAPEIEGGIRIDRV
jgi:[ribosomal protein S18]-alanine N-acetyltransferase